MSDASSSPVALATLLASALLSAPLAAQQEWWVDAAAGSDLNPGTYAQPLRSLSQAVANAGNGDRVFLLPGIYGSASGETFPITLGSQPQANLEIRGVGDVTMDLGGSPTPLFRVINGANGCRITNITFTNADRATWWPRVFNSGSGIDAGDAARDVEVDRCRFVNVNRVFVLWAGDNVQGWRIHDNLFDDCANDAILEYAGDNDIYNNTFVTGAYKAYISDSTTSRFHNNVVVGYSIALENNVAANNLQRYQNNWFYQCATVKQGPGLAGSLPPSNTTGVDPQFTNPTIGDYRPTPTSPLIDGGIALPAPRQGLAGFSRNCDSDFDGSLLPDIGAYERSPADLSVSWDPLTGVFLTTVTSAPGGGFAFVLFSFDDGAVNVPGQPVVLVDQASLIPAYLTGFTPNTWGFNLGGVPFAPGQRLVMQALVAMPGQNAFAASQQVWTQM